MTISSIGVEEQLVLRLDQEISYQLDEIIQVMQSITKEFNIDEADKKSPFKNVLSVAVEPLSSLEVIKTFIRYQVGRKDSSPIWKLKRDNQYFADVVVKQIDGLSKDADAILKRVEQTLKEKDLLKSHIAEKRIQILKKLHLQLAQLYLGYLAREHTALVGEKQFNR